MAAAGRIAEADIAQVRERSPIADVISARVTLRSAGSGSLKGLCPFHDENSPSFHVSPNRGVYHCFGCGVGGDVISFVMQTEMLSFTEAVEYLASKAGMQLRYVDADGRNASSRQQRQPGQRQRLTAAHAAAAQLYPEQLSGPEAAPAREFLKQRGFDQAAAAQFGCGFAPAGWDTLAKHLLRAGFGQQELITGGLCKTARSGSLIDRFRRRLLWPIKDLTGDVIGFGARKIFDDDDGPKYLNTPETPIY
ncbi:MAG: DNA primase, partial [Mycobacteriales bacterium]